ncbi:MotA/TolQ/ExbB proton channel family protein [Gemmatimonas aurantiaca]|nr:MotA/TolQ/ExbB proton channel family protein [Gemmatimonas aurantiaca]
MFDGGMWEIIGNSSFFGILIMLALVGFSLVSWAVIVTRIRLYKAESQAADELLTQFRKSKRMADTVSLAKKYQGTLLGALLGSGIQELVEIRERQDQSAANDSLTMQDLDGIDVRMELVGADEMQRLESGVVFLATTANASPFLGLLGTVVGIMVSFWEIGQTGSASLAIVAPGIAEALMATIFGLGAAIPAVIAYNWSNNRLKMFADQAANFSLEFTTRVKREFTQ